MLEPVPELAVNKLGGLACHVVVASGETLANENELLVQSNDAPEILKAGGAAQEDVQL